MAEKKEGRVKFCRYCDGIVDYDAKVCPHCGESLEIVDFEEMEWVKGADKAAGPVVPPIKAPPPTLRPLRGPPPVIQPTRKPPPVVKPVAKPPPVVQPVRRPPPVVQPVGKPPPVVRPVSKPPPEAKPPPVVQPVAPPPLPGGEPVRRGAGRRPARGGPPVVRPVSGEPPVVEPVPGGGLPPGVAPMLECPVCEAEMETEDEVGGVCTHCGESVCVACLMRANGVKVSASSERNLRRWREHAAGLSPERVRCPACGKRGVR